MVSCKVNVKPFWNHENFGSLAKLMWSPGLQVNFARDPKYSMSIQKIEFIIYINIYYIEIIYNLGNKIVVYLICNRINGFVGVWNEKAEQPVWTRTANACFARSTQAWFSANHNTSVTSGKWIQCSKHIAQASELDSCQSNLCHSWG